MKGMLRTLGGA